MPNHIQNRLRIIGTPEQVKEVLTFISSADRDGNPVQMDFNKIKPMPDGLSVEAHSGIIDWAEICTCQVDFSALYGPPPNAKEALERQDYKILTNRMKASTAMELITGKRKSVKDFTDEGFDMFVQCLKNFRAHGFFTWYEWSVANWGTKWNAYGQNDKRNTADTIHFETAWSAPLALIAELSKLFPECTLQFDYADEDSGSNAGLVTFKNGEPVNIIQPKSQTKEAYDIYFDLHPGRIDDYKLIGDKYEYVEDVQAEEG